MGSITLKVELSTQPTSAPQAGDALKPSDTAEVEAIAVGDDEEHVEFEIELDQDGGAIDAIPLEGDEDPPTQISKAKKDECAKEVSRS